MAHGSMSHEIDMECERGEVGREHPIDTGMEDVLHMKSNASQSHISSPTSQVASSQHLNQRASTRPNAKCKHYRYAKNHSHSRTGFAPAIRPFSLAVNPRYLNAGSPAVLASPRARTFGSEVDVVQMCREYRTRDSD